MSSTPVVAGVSPAEAPAAAVSIGGRPRPAAAGAGASPDRELRPSAMTKNNQPITNNFQRRLPHSRWKSRCAVSVQNEINLDLLR